MPQYKDSQLAETQYRILINGPALTMKTWWALRVAESGFNVIYLDADNNPQVIRNLSPEAKKRITRIELSDEFDNSASAMFLAHFCKPKEFVWDEDGKDVAPSIPKFWRPGHHYAIIDSSKLTKSDVVIIDSWTSTTKSTQRRYAQENNIDITLKAISDSDWKDYRWTGTFMEWVLEQLETLPCHVIVIAHAEELDIREKVDGKEKVVGQRYGIISSSRKNSAILPKYFTDILFFKMFGQTIYVDGQTKEGQVSGIRSFKPVRDTWEKLQFSTFVKELNLKSSGEECKAFKFLTAPEKEIASPAVTITQTNGVVEKSGEVEKETDPVAPPISIDASIRPSFSLSKFTNKGL